ncbi:hypothetical protein [Saccharothrix yanglingensis]|uniref:Uncharacterized protein n=1 Tax=Saccharothrix yanglingensis TaxID=659496 RepID=A0ABU0XAY8_9PSEU|nr:hypothetical protein [Saccharothrix yanglingensis]MDQ2588873.1 hypothetical protein [Saccharothrix yanglingensis]
MTRPTADEIRAHLLDRANDALRRPVAHGGEIGLLLCLDAAAFAHGLGAAWAAFRAELVERRAANGAGVRGGVHAVLGRADDDVVASVYAEFAHRHGFLVPDRLLDRDEHDRLLASAHEWCARDRARDEVLDRFGTPTALLGGTKPRHPGTLLYGAADRARPPVLFHLREEPDLPEPAVLAARLGGAGFPDGFAFTPRGAGITARDHGV